LEVPFFASAVGYVDVTTITTGSALPAVRDFENSIDDQLQPNEYKTKMEWISSRRRKQYKEEQDYYLYSPSSIIVIITQ
jgi:hypothetical protein